MAPNGPFKYYVSKEVGGWGWPNYGCFAVSVLGNFCKNHSQDKFHHVLRISQISFDFIHQRVKFLGHFWPDTLSAHKMENKRYFLKINT